jgi:hypothetical protein
MSGTPTQELLGRSRSATMLAWDRRTVASVASSSTASMYSAASLRG